MNYNDRKSCMWSLLNRTPTRRAALSSRKWDVSYHLINDAGKREPVCKLFFLATLGYSRTSSVVQELLTTQADQISPSGDKRGRHEPHNALGADCDALINAHIMSYNPAISHYRREHAPNRLYLPSELTERQMHQDFNNNHPNNKCSYVTYTRHVKKLSISFVKLGSEEY